MRHLFIYFMSGLSLLSCRKGLQLEWYCMRYILDSAFIIKVLILLVFINIIELLLTILPIHQRQLLLHFLSPNEPVEPTIFTTKFRQKVHSKHMQDMKTLKLKKPFLMQLGNYWQIKSWKNIYPNQHLLSLHAPFLLLFIWFS